MKKKWKIDFNVFFSSLGLLFGFVLVCEGLFVYGIGMHNVDLGHNLIKINAENNLKYKDINNNFEVWDSTTMYITGFNQLNEALYLCMLGVAIFIFSFCLLPVKQKGGS